jgi:hypothetical protein
MNYRIKYFVIPLIDLVYWRHPFGRARILTQ